MPRRTETSDDLQNHLVGVIDTSPDYWKLDIDWVNLSADMESVDFDPMLYVITHEDATGKIVGSAYFLLVQTENSDK